MFYKRGKLSLGHFDPNPVNWTHIYRISRKIGFFDVKCQKMAFSPTTQNYVFVYIYTSLEISTVKFFRQKLVRFSYTPYKYLSYCFITLENIQKVDFAFSFRPHSTKILVIFWDVFGVCRVYLRSWNIFWVSWDTDRYFSGTTTPLW